MFPPNLHQKRKVMGNALEKHFPSPKTINIEKKRLRSKIQGQIVDILLVKGYS